MESGQGIESSPPIHPERPIFGVESGQGIERKVLGVELIPEEVKWNPDKELKVSYTLTKENGMPVAWNPDKELKVQSSSHLIIRSTSDGGIRTRN